jgi:hypothetical protein
MADAATIMAAPDTKRMSDDGVLEGVDRNADGLPVLGGIALERMIGRGGMGAVFYGRHPRLRIPVAVKVLPFHLAMTAPESVARHLAEARTAARVQSNHLVRVFDVDEESGFHFIVMEYVDGQSAKEYTRGATGIGLPEKAAIRIIRAAAEGLRDAHHAGVIHRDVKPDNILIPRAADGTLDLCSAKLTDLGIAKSQETMLELVTVTGVAMGTPGFMAPEQGLDAKSAGPAADLYSLGASFYWLLTKRTPFDGPSAMAVLMRSMHEPHEPVATLRSDVSAQTSEIIDRCLGKEPDKRFSDVEEVLEALGEAHEAATDETNLWPLKGEQGVSRVWAWFVRSFVYLTVAGAASVCWWLVHDQLAFRRALHAAMQESGRLIASGDHEGAIARVMEARDALAHREGYAEEISTLDGIAAYARNEIARRELKARIGEFLSNLLQSRYHACKQYVDPAFLEKYGDKVPGILRLSSFAMRIAGIEEKDIRVRYVDLGTDSAAMAELEVNLNGNWKPIAPMRARLADDQWYLWLNWPPSKMPEVSMR